MATAADTPPKTRSVGCLQCGAPFPITRDWSRFCSDSCRAEHWRKDQEKRNPPAVGADAAGDVLLKATEAKQFTKPAKKWERVLTAFVAGQSFNRFDAERALSDHCLHSTVSTIQAKGIRIERRNEVVPGYQGIPTHVQRYRLAPDERAKAATLLGLSQCKSEGR